MIALRCINDTGMSHVNHRNASISNDQSYKGMSIGNSIYLIWKGKRYVGVFNKNRFEIISDKV